VSAHTAYSLAIDGNAAGARAIRDELETLSSTRYVSPFHFALIAAGLGEAAAVTRHLAEAAADGSGWTVFAPVERELAPYRGR
jgi:hypothetical protein